MVLQTVSVFSERYMGLPFPHDNYLNYEKTDLTREEVVKGLKSKTFLIVHGTADKRVNIHHSMLLMKKLTEHSVQFKVQVITINTLFYWILQLDIQM